MTTTRQGPIGRPVTVQPPAEPGPASSPSDRIPANGGLASARPGPSLVPVLVACAVLVGGTILGSSYYFAPLAERVRHPLHPWLRPSGYIGQSAGMLATVVFLFLWLYPLRKRVRWLRWTGAMSRWLDLHVGAALVLPLLTAVHASWRFDGAIGLGFWSMIVVCLSGVVGRYLYVQIPRSASGLELGAEEIAAERRQLLVELAQSAGLPPGQVQALLRPEPVRCAGLGVVATLRRLARDEVTRRRAARTLGRLCDSRPGGRRLDRDALGRVVRLARREMALTQQARMLAATHRVFRLWHVAHRPFAVTALVAVLLHVGVVVATGMTWLW